MDKNAASSDIGCLAHARDFQALEASLGASATPSQSDCEVIVQVMIEVDFGRLTLTPGWFPLAKRFLPSSVALRNHVFVILTREEAIISSASDKTDRSNLLYAIKSLNLSPLEIALLRRLRDRITPPVYREIVDEVLYDQVTADEREEMLRQSLHEQAPEQGW